MRNARAMDEVFGTAVVSAVVKPLRNGIFKKVLGFILVCSLIVCACEEIPTPTGIPIAPSNLIATVVSSSQIDLAWQDKSDNESGFKIERKIGAEGAWSQIATVGSNVSSYSNTALDTSTTYYYKVCAYNLAGHSEYSNEACCINVPIFKQCDSQWGSNQLGTCSIETICSHGCAVTSVAMILKYYGVDTDPEDLNTWLKNNSGYGEGCLILWEVADDRSGGSVEWAGKYTTDPNDWGTYSTNLSVQAKWEIDHGYPCVGKVNGHFVVITGYSDSLYSINDPYYDDSTISQSSITAIYTYHSGGDSLGEAVDNTDLTWTTGGDPTEWFAQTTTSYYDGDAAQSGDVAHGYSTWLQTTVTGPGMLTFYWKVSCYTYDYLIFYVNDIEQARISGSVDWQQKSYSLTSGTHTLRWRYFNASSSESGSDCGWVDKVEFTPPTPGALGEAVDNTDLTWTTGGDPTEWFAQTTTSYYDGDAAQSGDVAHGYSTWLQTTVTGPGMLTFYWKVSCYTYDYLIFYVNDIEQARISGSVDWQQKSYSLTSGTHTLRWRYFNASSSESGSDCGWVDKVEFTP